MRCWRLTQLEPEKDKPTRRRNDVDPSRRPHAAWIRMDRDWAFWVKKDVHPSQCDAEMWLHEFLKNKPYAGGVVLPDGEKPTGA